MCQSQNDQNKIEEQIKDLHDIDELKMNEVLDLITNKNNNRLKNIVQVSSDKKSLLQKCSELIFKCDTKITKRKKERIDFEN